MAAATIEGTESTGQPEEAGLPQMNPEHFASQIFWLAITFGLLFLLLSRVTLPKIAGSLAYKEAGFDRPIYFANEEGSSFDPKGQLVWAVFDNEIHSLVDHGRFPWENALVRPDAGDWTPVLVGVLRFPDRDAGVGHRDVHEREQSR